MLINSSKRYLFCLWGLLLIGLLPLRVVAQNPGIQYTIALNGPAYEVYLRPNFTPAAGMRTLTGQVTVKVPHNVTSLFTINDLINQMAGVTWSLSSRINAPIEDRNADYLSFTATFSDNAALLAGRIANQPVKLFTFQNTAACTGAVALMDNSDPFNRLPNSASTNPGNSLQVFGSNASGDIYINNYTTMIADCTKSDLSLAIGKPAPSFQMGVTSNVPANVTNSGAAPSGPIIVTLPLPTGISTVASFTSNGWSCTRKSGVVTCKNPGPSNPGTSSPFTIPMMPGASAVGTTPTLTGAVSTTNDSNAANNQAPPITPISPVAGSPDLSVAGDKPTPALKDGFTSQVAVTVKNVGSAPTTGSITVIMQLPTGLTTPANFVSNQWLCITNRAAVTCSYANPINTGTNQMFGVPVTPLASTVGPMPLPSITCNVVTPGDPVAANNSCAPISPGNVAGTPDLAVSLSQPTPLLKEGITSDLPVAVNNLGTASTAGLITVLLPLPPHINTPASFNLPSSWACTTTANTVTCTNPGSLTKDATNTFTLPVTPNASAVGMTPTFNASVSTSGEANTNNNSARPITVPAVTSGSILLLIKVFLGSVYDQASGLMRDDLRTLHLIPTASPYRSALATTNTAVLAITGNNAIVDWVLIELRDPNAPATIISSQAALLQRDGDVVGMDGITTLAFPPNFVNQRYYVVVKQRQHLGSMTASPVLLTNTPSLLDFTSPNTALYGSNAEKMLGGVGMLWGGDANSDKTVINAGPNNDVNQILTKILSDPANTNLSTNYIVAGYLATDVNMDGKTIAAGPNNDVNSILSNIFTHPGNINLAANYIIREQLP